MSQFITPEPLEARRLLAAAVDPSYGDGGVATFDYRAPSDNFAFDVDLLADGDVLVSTSASGSDLPALVRYDADGTRDATFGDGGVAVPAGLDGPVAEVLPQADGTFLGLAGDFGTGSSLVRFSAEGEVLPGWPVRVLDRRPVDLVALPGGRVLAVSEDALAVVRADGTPDASFGDNGVLVFEDEGGSRFFRPEAADVDAQGRPVVAGRFLTAATGDEAAEVRRFTTAGDPDPSFGGGDGIARPTAIPDDSRATDVAVGPDGRIFAFVGERADTTQGSVARGYAAALTPAGANDPVLGASGRKLVFVEQYPPPAPFTSAPRVFGTVAVLPGGNALIVGHNGGGFDDGPNGIDAQVGRLNVNAAASFQTLPFAVGGFAPLTAPDLDVAPDGRVAALAGGIGAGIPQQDVLLAVYAPSLAPAAGFSGDGRLLLDVPASTSQTFAGAAVDGQGRVLLADRVIIGITPFHTGRLTPAGQPDPSYGGTGQGVAELDGFGAAFAVAARPDGGSVAAGTTSTFDPDAGFGPNVATLVAYRDDGSPDPAFAPGDLQFGYESALLVDVAVAADGRIFTLARFTGVGTNAVGIARHRPDGTPDPTFGDDGLALLPPAFYTGLVPTADGGIYVGGTADAGGGAGALRVFKLAADGSPDGSFGNGGAAVVPGGQIIAGGDIDPAPGGGVFAVGYGDRPGQGRVAVVARLTADGTPVVGYGDAATPGVATVRLPSSSDVVDGIAGLPDGRVVLAGTARQGDDDGLAVALDAAGRPDVMLAPGGVRRVDLGADNDRLTDAVVQPGGGAVFLAGSTRRPDTAGDSAVVRLDVAAPEVIAAEFAFETSQAVRIRFGEDVSASLAAGDLTVTNLTTGQTVDPTRVSLSYDPATYTADFTFDGLPDGNYRATLPAGSVADAAGLPLAGDVTLDFFVLAGDFNRDRSVNLSDFTILANNFGRSGRTFSQGDANYDGVVNLSDFTILANRFGTTLPSPDDDGGSLFG